MIHGGDDETYGQAYFLDGLRLLNGLMVLILGAFEFDLKKG